MAKKFKNILLIGSTGLLGTAILNELNKQNYKISTPDSEELDVTDQELTSEYLKHKWPDLIINCAAVTDVEENEDYREIWPELVNHYGSVVLANICRDMGLRLVSFSCASVFDGAKRGAYTEEDKPSPINKFGQFNMEAEDVILSNCVDALIIRTAWLFGPGRTNFVSLVARKAQVDEQIEVAKGIYSNPSYTFDVAEAAVNVIEKGAKGIIHIVNSGDAEMSELAQTSLRKLGLKKKVSKVPADVLFAARRPVNGRLSTVKLEKEFGIVMRPWKEALVEYVKDYKTSDILLSDDIVEADDITPTDQGNNPKDA